MKTMFERKKRVPFLVFFSLIMSLWFLIIPVSAVAGTIYETESNNTYALSNTTHDDYNNYGTLSTLGDVDWWRITFAHEGLANFWMGNIPSGCDYDLYLYLINGTALTLLDSSQNRTGRQEYISYQVSAGITYYVKIISYSGFNSSKNYLFRAKNYTIPQRLYGNLTWDIQSIYYYVMPSAVSYLTPIANAASNWCYTGFGWNRLYPNTRTTEVEKSAIDIYGYSNSSDYTNGYTTFWSSVDATTGQPVNVNCDQEDWIFNRIYLNTEYMNLKTQENQQAIVAHEMGHCFGLDENNTNQESIMCQDGWGRSVTTIQKVDHIAFNLKHP